MSSLEFNPYVPFDVLRHAFVFDREADAKAFALAFDALLLLEGTVVQDHSDGKFLVAVEELNGSYSGD
jgi:hypothetical protein